jgi:HEAT repeat protein
VVLAADIRGPAGPGDPSGVLVRAILQLREVGSDEAFEVQTSAARPLEGEGVEGVAKASRRGVELALRQAVRQGHATIELAPCDDKALISKLSGGEGAPRDAAIELLASRRNEAALEPLLARLETDDLSIVRRTTGWLIELRSPASVKALIEVSRIRNVEVQRELVFAIGAVGGDEAEAYLDVVASGHDDTVIRASAAQALEELRRRAPSKKRESQ